MLRAITVFFLSAMMIHSTAQANYVKQNMARPSIPSNNESTAPESAPRIISNEEESELRKRLKPEPETHIAINYWAGEPPASILEAKVRGIKRDRSKDESRSETAPLINDYAMRASLTLVNNTRLPITDLGLRFKNTGVDHTFCVYKTNLRIVPNKESRIEIDFMLVAGNPADLIVDIVGAKFEGGNRHGFFPVPPALLDDQLPKNDVDSRPEPLDGAQPRYTEQARYNRVQGTVRLSLLIAADGSSKDVKVKNALPDGLTEEAMLAVHQMRFQPARKNGEWGDAKCMMLSGAISG